MGVGGGRRTRVRVGLASTRCDGSGADGTRQLTEELSLRDSLRQGPGTGTANREKALLVENLVRCNTSVQGCPFPYVLLE